MDAQSRARLLTLAAQLVGSRLASRQRLLDYYAVGGVDILHSQLRPRLDWSSGLALIHRFLESMDRR
jgi:aromatic ring hydroxylase